MDVKVLQKDVERFGFTPSLANPKMGKEIKREKVRLYEDRVKRIIVTDREGTVASERRNDIGEDKRMLSRLAAR